jgi:mRNA-degrading endonuclease RelE of RelBE toxin-antitoxin system
VRALQGFDNVWRVRIGRSYRLLFRVHDAELEVLDLVHRQDLEKKLHQLKALR